MIYMTTSALVRRIACGIPARATAAVLKKLENQRQTLQARIQAYTAKVSKLSICSKSQAQPTEGPLAAFDTEALLVKEVLDELNVDSSSEDTEDINDNSSDLGSDSDSDSESDFDELDDLDSDPETNGIGTTSNLLLLAKPEQLNVWLPSRNPGQAKHELCHIELQLRSAQALECLQKIRSGIGEKSVLIRFLVRRNRDTGQYKRGRSWKEVGTVHGQLIKAWALYRRCQLAITRLPHATTEQQRFLPIEKEHLRELKDITASNRFDQHNDTLPWFWTMHGPSLGDSNAMHEGMPFYKH
jgi:hypothetical protein